MVLQAVVILLIILIVANVGVGFYNRFYPPCFDAKEYFSKTRQLPDGAVASLGSIPSGNDVKYIGARLVSTGKNNVIGLTSWNNIYSENTDADLPDENHPIFDEVETDLETDTTEVSRAKPKKSTSDSINPSTGTLNTARSKYKDSAYDAISEMYPTASQQSSSTGKKNTDVGGKLVTFEEELEGVPVQPRTYRTISNANPTIFHNATERDGYH